MLVSKIKNGQYIARDDRDFEEIIMNNCEIHYIKMLYGILTGQWGINYNFITDTFLFIRKMEKKYHKKMLQDSQIREHYHHVIIPYFEKYGFQYIDKYGLFE